MSYYLVVYSLRNNVNWCYCIRERPKLKAHFKTLLNVDLFHLKKILGVQCILLYFNLFFIAKKSMEQLIKFKNIHFSTKKKIFL